MNLKSGFLTSEFWSMMFGQAGALGVGLGVISQQDATQLTGQLVQLATAVLTILGTTKQIVAYIRSRQALKTPPAA